MSAEHSGGIVLVVIVVPVRFTLLPQVAKEGVKGQAVEAQVERGSSQGKEEVPRSLWQSLKRRLLMWLVAGTTHEVQV